MMDQSEVSGNDAQHSPRPMPPRPRLVVLDEPMPILLDVPGRTAIRRVKSPYPTPNDASSPTRRSSGSSSPWEQVLGAVNRCKRPDRLKDLCRSLISQLRTVQQGEPPPPGALQMLARTDSTSDSNSFHTGDDRSSFAPSPNTGMLTPSQQPLTVPTTEIRYDQLDEYLEAINDYIVLKRVGKGNHGEVLLVLHAETDEIFAVKCLPKKRHIKFPTRRGSDTSSVASSIMCSNTHSLNCEIAIMKKLRHPNIVTLHEVIEDESQVFLVMQYVERGPIVTVSTEGTCTPIEPQALIRYASQMAAGLHYLHRNNIFHRDLKPENILMGDDDNVYIADFGTSEMVELSSELSKSTRPRGTPAYFAPEVFEGKGNVSPGSADVWALGVTLYALLTGHLPFFHTQYAQLRERVLHWELQFPDHIACDPDYVDWMDMLRGMLTKNPARRSSLSVVRRHRLFREYETMNMSASLITPLISPTRVSNQEVENAIVVRSQFYAVTTPGAEVPEVPAQTSDHFSGSWPAPSHLHIPVLVSTISDFE